MEPKIKNYNLSHWAFTDCTDVGLFAFRPLTLNPPQEEPQRRDPFSKDLQVCSKFHLYRTQQCDNDRILTMLLIICVSEYKMLFCFIFPRYPILKSGIILLCGLTSVFYTICDQYALTKIDRHPTRFNHYMSCSVHQSFISLLTLASKSGKVMMPILKLWRLL